MKRDEPQEPNDVVTEGGEGAAPSPAVGEQGPRSDDDDDDDERVRSVPAPLVQGFASEPVAAPAGVDMLSVVHDSIIRKIAEVDEPAAARMRAVIMSSSPTYPTTAARHIVQYDERVFVWFDETDAVGGAANTLEEAQAAITKYARELAEPVVRMLLHCPLCRAKHVDLGVFATKKHHTHACQECGHVWRPAVEATVGVEHLPGFGPPALVECAHCSERFPANMLTDGGSGSLVCLDEGPCRDRRAKKNLAAMARVKVGDQVVVGFRRCNGKCAGGKPCVLARKHASPHCACTGYDCPCL